MKKNILVTGCAGFIGFHVSETFLKKKFTVFGIDNLNKYYDKNLKLDRLKILKRYKNFKFYKLDISDELDLKKIFKNKINFVIHLAAQAGVRYSIVNPYSYFKSNLLGFGNLIHLSMENKVKKFIFASSSSIYGDEKILPFNEETSEANNPIQAYAATKRSNEIIAKSYYNLFKLNIIGLRLFTVYGNYGRPDMAIYGFTKNIIEDKKIKIFNHGNHFRDFTHVNDVKDAIFKIIKKPNKKKPSFNIFNLGSGRPVKLNILIKIIEKYLKKKSKKIFINQQAGDMKGTFADISKIKKFISYKAKVNIDDGIKEFVSWYKKYYGNKTR